MEKTKLQHKKQFIQTEEKLEKTHYRIIIGLMIFAVTYYFFIEPKTIGKDVRYSIYIFWLPTITGMFALGTYRRQFLIKQFRTNTGIALRSFMIFFYLLQGLIFSYLSFGQVAKMSWDYANYVTAKQKSSEVLNCEVLGIWVTKKSNRLGFTLNNIRETFNVSYQFIKDYKDENPKDYKVVINARRGIWNYYVVDSWEMKRR